MRLSTRCAALATLTLPVLLSAGVPSGARPNQTASLIDIQGTEVGRIHLQESSSRGVLVALEVSGLEAGTYEVLVHERARCETPTFDTAGGPLGESAIAVLRFDVPGPGRVEVERLGRGLSLSEEGPNALVDGDGSSFIVYAVGQEIEGETATEGALTRGAAVACAAVRR